MKLIAHRGASLLTKENSLEGLMFAASLGADAVECDLRRAADGEYIIFHDDNLKRLAGVDRRVGDLTCSEMSKYLSEKGHVLLCLDELLSGYKSSVPVLLHIKQDVEESLVKKLKASGIDFICGAASAETAGLCSQVFPKTRVLGFIPFVESASEFYKNGAGIIRLWENWLFNITPADIKERFCSEIEVFIMSRDENGSMNGSEKSLDYFLSLGADGVLLNDIKLALEWKKKSVLENGN